MHWHLLSVELTVCGWILVLLAADSFLPSRRSTSLWRLAIAGVAVCTGVLLWQRSSGQMGGFQDMLRFDAFSSYFRGLFLLATAVVIVMTRAFHRTLGANLAAFYLLLFTALLGMLILASVTDLLMLFLGLELLTFSLYIMAAYLKTDARSVEAGMKYLILGSVSSGFLVYGIALLYGASGSTNFSAVAASLGEGAAPAAHAGLLLVLAGLGFKVAAVPFHLWVPDVYEGAPTPVVALLSVGSKMAGIVAMVRVLFGALPPASQGAWTEVLAVLSAMTMCYGNLGAIPQRNIKRLLGYSSIGHAGYLLMGLSSGSRMGVEAVSYYLLAYLFSNLAVFLVVVVVSEAIGSDLLDDYRGLSRRSGWLAAAMFIGMLSLSGVPPLAGFVGKLLVLLSAAETGRLWLLAVGAVNVAISLYYYLLVVKRMYLEAPAAASPIRPDPLTKIVLAVLVLGILAVGTVQEPFLQLIASSSIP
jgi:NADH-quinone oxidoreductase subunit N